MSTQNIVVTLNQLLADQRFCLVNYVSQSLPWTHAGNEALSEAICSIANDHEHYSRRLSELIGERDGTIGPGTFSTVFTSLNDLSLDYLLTRIIVDQRNRIQNSQEIAAELMGDEQAWNLAREILGSERAHFDILNEFLPETGTTTPSEDQDYSQVA